jgi:hypothetical protein
MNEASARLRNLLLWVIPFVVVVAALGYETDWGRDVAHDVAPPPPEGLPPPVAVALLPEYRIDGGVDARKETVERALFNPTRRPAPPAAPGAGAGASMPRGLYTLTGTTVDGSVATAFLRETKGGKSHAVHQGETLDGLLVAEVRPDLVRLKKGDDFEDLQLKIASGPKTTIQVAAPAPAQAAGAPGQPVQRTTGAGTRAAGGTGAATQNQNPRGTRAVVPPPAANPPAAGTSARPGVVSVGELLQQRRRAAREAAGQTVQPQGPH